MVLEVRISTSLEALEAEALKLSPAERSHLLERLVASLDADPEVEAAWERDADRTQTEPSKGKGERGGGCGSCGRDACGA